MGFSGGTAGQTVQGCVLEAGEAKSASRNGELVLSLLCVELGELNEFERHDTNPNGQYRSPHQGLTKFWYETTLAGRGADRRPAVLPKEHRTNWTGLKRCLRRFRRAKLRRRNPPATLCP